MLCTTSTIFTTHNQPTGLKKCLKKISLFTPTIHFNLRWAERGVWLNVSLIALIPSSFLVFNLSSCSGVFTWGRDMARLAFRQCKESKTRCFKPTPAMCLVLLTDYELYQALVAMSQLVSMSALSVAGKGGFSTWGCVHFKMRRARGHGASESLITR